MRTRILGIFGLLLLGCGTAVVPANYKLTIVPMWEDDAAGRVVSESVDIDCDKECTSSVPERTLIQLSAVPDAHSRFEGWSGDKCTGTGVCEIRLTEDAQATAVFSLKDYALDIETSGAGDVLCATDVQSFGPCQAKYPAKSTVALKVRYSLGARFLGWMGACEGAEETCPLTMDGAKVVVASFAPAALVDVACSEPVVQTTEESLLGFEIRLGDFDGNGMTDYMYITDGSYTAEPKYAKGQIRHVYLSIGDGSFGDGIIEMTEQDLLGYELQLGDFDGNGMTDYMYITDGTHAAAPEHAKGQQRRVYLSNGEGVFLGPIATSYTETSFAGYELQLGDFNGDGKTDYMYSRDESIDTGQKGRMHSVWLSGGNGAFGERIQTLQSETHFGDYELKLGDFDGDGNTDFMYITDGSSGSNDKGQQRSIWLSKGNGSFSKRIATSYTETNFAGYELQLGDFNGDGKTDYMYISDGVSGANDKGQQRSVWLSKGGGTFLGPIATSYTETSFAGYELQLGDFDGDGSTDFMYITDGSSGSNDKGQQRSIWLSKGNGTFIGPITASCAATHFGGYELQLGDFDGDGRSDYMYITDGTHSREFGYAKGQQRSVFLSSHTCTAGLRGQNCDINCTGAAVCKGDYIVKNAKDLEMLRDCSSIEGTLRIGNTDVADLHGLECIKSVVGHLSIDHNDELTSLRALKKLKSVSGRLEINTNKVLQSLMGLENLGSVDGKLVIRDNKALTSLESLQNLTSVAEGFDVWDNNALKGLEGLEGLTAVRGSESLIRHNDSLTSLKGLKNVKLIEGSLFIQSNRGLATLEGLEGITRVGGSVSILSNPSLTSLKGLESLRSIGGDVNVRNNNALTSLTSLESLTAIEGDLYIRDNDVLPACAAKAFDLRFPDKICNCSDNHESETCE